MARSPLLVIIVWAVLLMLFTSLCITPAAAAERSVHELSPDAAPHTDETAFRLPGSVATLTDATFDAFVFPNEKKKAKGKQQHAGDGATQEPSQEEAAAGTAASVKEQPFQPWLIFFYAPWCQHCRHMMPQFINASVLLEERIKYPHAKFAVVNSQKSTKLTKRFGVEKYPTLIYTTGKGRNWFEYEGGHSVDSFVQFAVYAQSASDAGSFADDVTDVTKFFAITRQTLRTRVPLYVFVPARSPSTRHTARSDLWNVAVDGAASIGNVRFAVIYERDMDSNWREALSAASAAAGGEEKDDESSSSSNAQLYAHIIDAARKCGSEGRNSGPAGEVLISTSDRSRTPQCYSGPWVKVVDDDIVDGKKKKKGVEATEEKPSQRVTIDPLLTQFIMVNGFRAIEEVTAGMFSLLGREEMHYLGLLVTDGRITQADTAMLPVLRDMVQTASEELASRKLTPQEEAKAARMSWAYIDGRVYEEWRDRYGISVEDLPTVVIIDTRMNRFFRTGKHVGRFEEIKREVPWSIDGEHRQLLEGFTKDVLANKYWGEKSTYSGALVERLSQTPFTIWLYRAISYDDIMFLTIIFSAIAVTVILVIVLCMEPAINDREAPKRDVQSEKKRQ